MADIRIPAAALEAMARGIYEVMYPPQSHPAWEYARETLKEIFRGYARAAFEAMVEAWPKWLDMDADPGAALILPLMEKPDGE